MVSWIHGPQKCMMMRGGEGPEGPGGGQGPKVYKGGRAAPSTHSLASQLDPPTLPRSKYLDPLLGFSSLSPSSTLHALCPLGPLLITGAPQPYSCLSCILRVLGIHKG